MNPATVVFMVIFGAAAFTMQGLLMAGILTVFVVTIVTLSLLAAICFTYIAERVMHNATNYNNRELRSDIISQTTRIQQHHTEIERLSRNLREERQARALTNEASIYVSDYFPQMGYTRHSD